MIAAAAAPYAAPEANGKLRLLVFGGSQGARVMAEIVPAAIERLAADLRARLAVVQQARGEDLESVRGIYARLGVAADCAPFFSDLPARMAAAHLVISRSGASTVAELSAIGRPGILVPLPHSLDQDQFVNAGVLDAAGGAIRVEQRALHRDRLASEIAGLAGAPDGLPAWPKRQRRHARRRRAPGRLGVESGGTLSISSKPDLFRPSTSCNKHAGN